MHITFLAHTRLLVIVALLPMLSGCGGWQTTTGPVQTSTQTVEAMRSIGWREKVWPERGRKSFRRFVMLQKERIEVRYDDQ